MQQEQRFHKIGSASRILGVSKIVLRNWACDSSIRTIRTPGNQILFDLSSIEGFKVEQASSQAENSEAENLFHVHQILVWSSLALMVISIIGIPFFGVNMLYYSLTSFLFILVGLPICVVMLGMMCWNVRA